MHDRIAEIIFLVAMMAALCTLVVGCVTTRLPDGTITTQPADGVVEGLQAAVIQAGIAYAEAQTDYERDTIASRLTKLRTELAAWQAFLESVKK